MSKEDKALFQRKAQKKSSSLKQLYNIDDLQNKIKNQMNISTFSNINSLSNIKTLIPSKSKDNIKKLWIEQKKLNGYPEGKIKENELTKALKILDKKNKERERKFREYIKKLNTHFDFKYTPEKIMRVILSKELNILAHKSMYKYHHHHSPKRRNDTIANTSNIYNNAYNNSTDRSRNETLRKILSSINLQGDLPKLNSVYNTKNKFINSTEKFKDTTLLGSTKNNSTNYYLTGYRNFSTSGINFSKYNNHHNYSVDNNNRDKQKASFSNSFCNWSNAKIDNYNNKQNSDSKISFPFIGSYEMGLINRQKLKNIGKDNFEKVNIILKKTKKENRSLNKVLKKGKHYKFMDKNMVKNLKWLKGDFNVGQKIIQKHNSKKLLKDPKEGRLVAFNDLTVDMIKYADNIYKLADDFCTREKNEAYLNNYAIVTQKLRKKRQNNYDIEKRKKLFQMQDELADNFEYLKYHLFDKKVI